MATYRNLTADDAQPDSLTRQWFNPASDTPERAAKATKGAVFGMYAVAIGPNGGMVIPLVNQSASDRADELAATEGWTVQRVKDSRLVETRITGESKPKLTKSQQEAVAALMAGTATDEQKAALASLV
jgi:hypothetical protein